MTLNVEYKIATNTNGLTTVKNNDVTSFKDIVKCKDCKYFIKGWDQCIHPKSNTILKGMAYLDVEPYGFCYWGEQDDNVH